MNWTSFGAAMLKNHLVSRLLRWQFLTQHVYRQHRLLSSDGSMALVSERRRRRQRLKEKTQTAVQNNHKFSEGSVQELLELSGSGKLGSETASPEEAPFLSDLESEREEYLRWKQDQTKHAFRPKIDPSETSVVLFPGQGSQFVGMGADLLDYPNVLEMYKMANEILGFDLLNLCLHGPESELNKTVNCQLAVFVTSLAAVEKLRETKPWLIENCVASAGFSVGEYAALVFAGAMSLEDALDVLKVRAETMQQASEIIPSGMISVFCGRDSKLGLGMEAAREYCRKHLQIHEPVCTVANYLCPEVKVVAGHKVALDFLRSKAGDLRLKRLKDLPVSGAFHTPLMKPAVKPVSKALEKVSIERPVIPVHCNVSVMPYNSENMIRRLLVQQIYKPVKWEQIMHTIYSRPKGDNFPETVEAGPGKQLGVLLKQVNSLAYGQYSNVFVGSPRPSQKHERN